VHPRDNAGLIGKGARDDDEGRIRARVKEQFKQAHAGSFENTI
jgi:hypothetical protein